MITTHARNVSQNGTRNSTAGNSNPTKKQLHLNFIIICKSLNCSEHNLLLTGCKLFATKDKKVCSYKVDIKIC